jgi:hypothetical protein
MNIHDARPLPLTDMTEERTTMTNDKIQNMPKTSSLMLRAEFVAWIASRKEAGATIDVETAELKGWWAPKGDPYALSWWRPKGADRNYNDAPEETPHFFVRYPHSRGWVWQGDLPHGKRAAMQARIDEHNRKVEEFYANRQAAGRLIDIETCECFCNIMDETDPYGRELAPYGVINYVLFVCNKDSDDWIWVYHLPAEKREALYERRGRRESLDREQVISDLFDALRQGGRQIFVAVESVIAEAEERYGEKIVKDALSEYQYLCGVIGGLMIERGYLTMEHVTELLRSAPKGPPEIHPVSEEEIERSKAEAEEQMSDDIPF